MFWFCVRSLFSEYGRLFLRHIALAHPVKTVRALFRSRGKREGDFAAQSAEYGAFALGRRSIVGLGFCMKPKDAPCPSGSDLHGCGYLERYAANGGAQVPPACRDCYIRKTGLAALRRGSAFYIMTSAKDILFDVFKPSLETGKFETGVFTLCRYSFQPFFTGMCISGIRGFLFPFCEGDCRDYKTWTRADRGEKDEQTFLTQDARSMIETLLGGERTGEGDVSFEKRGNVFYPDSFGS